MVAPILGLVALAISAIHDADHWSVLAGVLILHGGFGGAISAMLYKIVPFLTWLHLTQSGVKAPNMKKLLPDPPIRQQLRLHLVVLVVLVAGIFEPLLARLAGLLMAAEFTWLLLNLLRVIRAWHAPGAHKKFCYLCLTPPGEICTSSRLSGCSAVR